MFQEEKGDYLMRESKLLLILVLVAGLTLSGSLAFAQGATRSEEEFLAAVKKHPNAKIGPLLANLYDEYQQSGAKSKRGDKWVSKNPILKIENSTVVVEGVAKDPQALMNRLASLGATDIRGGAVFSARVPISKLGALAKDAALHSARPALAKAWQSDPPPGPPVFSQGDHSLRSDAARTDFSVDGSGIRIGALSDSFGANPDPFIPGTPTTTVAEDQANGDLPVDLDVLADAGGSDEGRAMMQLMYDVAPGSSMAFHTAFDSYFDFACGIMELGGINTFGAFNACFGFNGEYDPAVGGTSPDPSRVIADDVIYFSEPMFSDGAIAQAVDTVYAAGIPYFSSAGNNARLSYEADYREVEDFGNNGNNLNRSKGGGQGPNLIRVHDFDEGDDDDSTQTVRIFPSGGQAVIVFAFQWDQPFLFDTIFANLLAGETVSDAIANAKFATTDLDFLIYKDNNTLVQLCPPGVATGITCQLSGEANIGGDPFEFAVLFYAGPPSKAFADFQIRVVNSGQLPGEAVPTRIKYVPFEIAGFADIIEHDSESGTSYGHANAAGAASIGAATWYATEEWTGGVNTADPDGDTFDACVPACLNDFSSAGGVPIYFDALGNRLASAVVRLNPLVTGPDGGNTTFFTTDSTWDDDNGNGKNSPFSTFVTPELDEPGNEWPNFFGTSASAPHVAAVAALMLEANPALTPDEVYQILVDTAQDMTDRFSIDGPPPLVVLDPIDNGAGYDFDSGYGFVDAYEALAAVPTP